MTTTETRKQKEDFFRARHRAMIERKKRIADVAGAFVRSMDGRNGFKFGFPQWQGQNKKIAMKVYVQVFPRADGVPLRCPREAKVYMVFREGRRPFLDSHWSAQSPVGIYKDPVHSGAILWRLGVHDALLRTGFEQHQLSTAGFDEAWAVARSRIGATLGGKDVQEGD